MPDFKIEQSYNGLVVGIDEAGRGPIAGPVVAACAYLDSQNYPATIDDSKKISAAKRRKIFEELKNCAKYGVGIVASNIIDDINILQATKLAMLQAYDDLVNKYKINPQTILVDGNFVPFAQKDQITEMVPIIKGDQKSLSIAAASIIAKEIRDEIMLENHQNFPQYGFDKHMGYPTKNHIANLEKFGVLKIHRQSFAPVKKAMQQ